MGKPLNLPPLSLLLLLFLLFLFLFSLFYFFTSSICSENHSSVYTVIFPFLYLSYASFPSPTLFLPYLNKNQKSNPHPHPNLALWGSATAHQYGMLQLHDICLSGFNFLYLQTRTSFCALHCVALNCEQEKTII